MWRGMLMIVLATAVGCDRPGRPGVQPVVLSKRTVVEVEPLCQLTPNRIAHVAVDRFGRIFYNVESPQGADGVLCIGETGLPRATRLTSANILAALGETVGGSGSIQDLVRGGDGAIYFYFVGGKGRGIRACLGRFITSNETINILIDTAHLARFSNMGESIALARGKLLPQGNSMGLFLRHTDAWSFFTFDIRRPSLEDAWELIRPFDRIDAEETPTIDLAQTRYELAPGYEKDWLLFDRTSGTLWQVAAGGKATVRALLTGLPREVSAPLPLDAEHILFFVADSEPIESEMSDVLRRRLPQVTYPALFQITEQQFTAVGREDFRARSEFPLYAMRMRQLASPAKDVYVGYDQSSGQIIRLRQVQED